VTRQVDASSRLDERPYEGPITKPHKVKKAPKGLPPMNEERRARNYETDFVPHGDFVRTLPCIIRKVHPRLRTQCRGRVVAAHFRSRGAGGDRFSLFPACEGHHDEAHDGIATFQARYELDLAIEVEAVNLADPGLLPEELEAAEQRLAKLREPR
jgi:hypothetical protein